MEEVLELAGYMVCACLTRDSIYIECH